ncbi:MAG: amidase [Hyphomicrobiaceae bacterium]
MVTRPYDPTSFSALNFEEAAAEFAGGRDTPSAYLERCLATIRDLEPTIQAFVCLNEDGACAAAEASTKRWRAGSPLSPIDGMPVGIKDLLETKDMPTQMNCDALAGNFPKRDNAAVWALRDAGAIVIGKTVTAELGGTQPGPTTNPFDSTRTPGGSSSGSAAAVAARMIPAAIGTQVAGSIIRPAAYCGNFALKPSQGAINRGERQATSMSTHGVHAGSVADMWRVSIEIARRAGGDRGCRALVGPTAPPTAQRPQRLIVLETEGWASALDDKTRSAFELLLARLEQQGISLLRRSDDRRVDELEHSISEATRVCFDIIGWENRWTQRNIINEKGGGLSARAMTSLERAERMRPEDYEKALMERETAQLRHAQVAALADATITLACPGPAPIWRGDQTGEPLVNFPTGNPIFNCATSMLFAPVVSLPMLAVSGMPVGAQLIGQLHEDARMTSLARWIHENVEPVVV